MERLNLGCGVDIREGWVNLDYFQKDADVVHDLNTLPYPFDDNTFDEIESCHVLEHLFTSPVLVMDELIRISKNGGKIRISLPFYNSPSPGNPSHFRGGFNYWAFVDTKRRPYYLKHGALKLLKRSSKPTKFAKWIPNPKMMKGLGLREIISLFLGNITSEVSYVFEVQKE